MDKNRVLLETPVKRGKVSSDSLKKFFFFHRPTLTAICVGFSAIAVLQAVIPRALVFGTAAETHARAVPAFEAVRPLALVQPVAFGFDAQAVALALSPVTLVCVPAGPSVHPDHFETVIPRAGELALTLRSRADAMAVRFATFPSAAVRAAVIELKATSTHPSLIIKKDGGNTN